MPILMQPAGSNVENPARTSSPSTRQSATLRALRHITRADGRRDRRRRRRRHSSGRLRQEMPILPPGDLRMALASLCESPVGLTWRDVQLRLGYSGPLNGRSARQPADLRRSGALDGPVERPPFSRTSPRCAGARPAHVDDADWYRADMNDRPPRRRRPVGSSLPAPSSMCVSRPEAEVPPRPPKSQADWVVLGPGSWYTSVIPPPGARH